jgi:hypothetical protein
MPFFSPHASILTSATLAPEYELLLACLPLKLQGDRVEAILKQRESEIDWDSFIKVANWHGVTPLVYRTLSETASQWIPRTHLARLMDFYIANAARNRVHSNTLLDLLDLFEKHQIPVISFKGPILAQTLYGNLNLRCFADLDLMVRTEDTLQARQLLMQQHFVPKQLYDKHLADRYLQSRCWDDTFTQKEIAVTVDLHETLTPSYFPVQFDLEGICQRLQPVLLQQKKVYSFSDEDLLLYLCVHGCKELWRRLIWVCDIAELVRSRPQLRWDWLLAQAQQSGIERMLLLSLALAHTLQNLELPDKIQQQINTDPSLSPLLREFQSRLLQDIDSLIEDSKAQFWTYHHPLHLKMRERWQDKLPQYWVTLKFLVLPNEEDRRFVSLPSWFTPLYFAIRPMRLLLKHRGH